VITGAGSRRGIGQDVAHALAAQGWDIAVLDLDVAAAKEIADQVAQRHGVTALGIRCDVTDRDDVDQAVATVEGNLTEIGALVNNAGITSPTTFLDVADDEWERIFAVNVRGSYLMTK